jgi:hypothetical protein
MHYAEVIYIEISRENQENEWFESFQIALLSY